MQRIANRLRQLIFKSVHQSLVGYLCLSMACSGCRFPQARNSMFQEREAIRTSERVTLDVVRQTELPDTSLPSSDNAAATPEPRTLLTELPEDDDSRYWNLSLQEAIHYGLSNSRVLNDLGGSILRNPDGVASNTMSAIVQADPRFGIEGALSAYDARLNIRNSFEQNHAAYNNFYLAGGAASHTFQQLLNTSTTELIKQSVTGGQWAVRNVTIFDQNTMPSNLFPSTWTTYYEAEARQALWQGGGVNFNRIAGANPVPGYYNGVKIARLRSDITQAEFEIALRDYLSNIENAYWDLHFAYRDLQMKVELRDASLEVYDLYKNRVNLGTDEQFRTAQVREQYYRFQEDVMNSLAGRRVDGTRTNNGSGPGTFRGSAGVYLTERRLRLLLGVPTSDSRLIRPSDDAMQFKVVHNWEVAKAEALERRPELRRQKFKIQASELELVAARNFLQPRLDLVGRYRLRGFGNNLVGNNLSPTASATQQTFPNAYGNLFTGEYQESQVGVEFSMPIGFRQAHAAVLQAELKLSRERAVMHEQERQIIHDLGNAIADVTRSLEIAKTANDRLSAASEYLEGLTKRIRDFDFGNRANQLEQWVDAQRRFADAKGQYYLALCDHQIAVKNVNYEKGTLLEYDNIMTVDGVAAKEEPKPKVNYDVIERAAMASRLARAETETEADAITDEKKNVLKAESDEEKNS